MVFSYCRLGQPVWLSPYSKTDNTERTHTEGLCKGNQEHTYVGHRCARAHTHSS